jgi:hypothetical protein
MKRWIALVCLLALPATLGCRPMEGPASPGAPEGDRADREVVVLSVEGMT